MDRDTAYALRGQAVRAAVATLLDAGVVQQLELETHEGIRRTGIEVMQPFGLAASAPAGAITIVFSMGGDQGDMVALPPSAPGHRFGGLAAGETALYNAGGDRVHLQSGGVVVILAASKVRIVAPQVEIVASGGVTITGDVVVAGNLTATGEIADSAGSMGEMRSRYNAHSHGVGPGPSPLMD